jgi:hypothetical protein
LIQNISNVFTGFIMRKIYTAILLALAFMANHQGNGQSLRPQFDRNEYADMLWLQFYALSDSLPAGTSFKLNSGTFTKVFSSPEVGLYNKCVIFQREDGVVVLELRGTVNKPESWLENFYAGMVPAQGSLQLTSDYTFQYKLAEHENAAVHVGWLLGTGFLSKAYLPVLDSLVQKGNHHIIVTGHSQGGALAFLNTSFLHYYYQARQQPVVLKTYASAAPKPGNQFYAYDFDFVTRNGMGFRVVNTADWVPETPFSLQTLKDYNVVNPFTDAKATIKKQKFFVRLYMNNVYKKLDGSSAKAARKFRKYLGEKIYTLASKSLPGYEKPSLNFSMNYATAGTPVVLPTDTAYHQQFTFDGKNVFVHHMYKPYLHLLDQYYPVSKN